MKTLIIAEAGVNHNGSIQTALELVNVAAAAGVDIIKFQSFQAENLVSRKAEKAPYQVKNTGTHETQLEMLKKLELSHNDHELIRSKCKQENIQFLSSPFDIHSLHFLIDKMAMRTIKVPSGELTNAPFLLEIARTDCEIILSTGMATLGDIEQALGILAFGFQGHMEFPNHRRIMEALLNPEMRVALAERVTLLHCTTEYPAPFDEINLNLIKILQQAFGLKVGYSDHSEGIVVSLAAVALGAQVIEKHFTLSKDMPGPDHKASLEPHELRELVKGIRIIESVKGLNSIKAPTLSELKNMDVARKSLVARQNIGLGEKYTTENICVMRPGTGIPPIKFWEYITERFSQRNYEEGDLID